MRLYPPVSPRLLCDHVLRGILVSFIRKWILKPVRAHSQRSVRCYEDVVLSTALEHTAKRYTHVACAIWQIRICLYGFFARRTYVVEAVRSYRWFWLQLNIAVQSTFPSFWLSNVFLWQCQTRLLLPITDFVICLIQEYRKHSCRIANSHCSGKQYID